MKFDFTHAIASAWDALWKRNLDNRATGNDFRGNTYYICALDVERLVRVYASETLMGKPWGSTEQWDSYGSQVRVRGDLQRMVRDWLLHNPNITGHNFNRGHISGMRFRPRGQPLGPAEVATIEQKAKRRANPRPRPVHYNKTGYGRRPQCIIERNKGKSIWGNFNRSTAHTTKDQTKVTCKQCLKWLLEQQTVAATEAQPNQEPCRT